MPTHHSDENNQARGKGEKFTVWPDPTGRLGVARLWPHLLDFLQTDGVLPANWQAPMATFDEATLLLVFQVHPHIMTGNQFTEQWNGVKDCVRTHLQAVNPCAQVAFGLYPHDDRQALQLLAELSPHSLEPDALALPPLYAPEELSP